jgi:hypothetical protein
MARWFLFALTVSLITGHTVSTERTLAYQQVGGLSLTVSPSLSSPLPDPNEPKEKHIMGVVRHVEPAKGIVILQTHTDVLVVRAPTEVCLQLREGDVIMATVEPDEEKVPV